MKIARSIRKFVIPHQKLIDYGVITSTETSGHIKRCLERDNNLVIDTDFILLSPGQQIPTDVEQKEEDVLLQLEQNPDGEQKEDGVSSQLGRYSDDEQKAGRGKTQKAICTHSTSFQEVFTMWSL